MLFKICTLYASSKPDREDLYQEILIQLWKSFPSFRGEAKISTWIYRIGLNTAIGGLRKQRPVITSFDPENMPRLDTDITDDAEKRDQLRILEALIQRLNEVEKAIIMLFLDEKSYREMEEILGISENTLRVRINRIKKKLKELKNISDD